MRGLEGAGFMHLLFVNYEFPPVGGGAAYASIATAREFVSMGHRVDFLTAATPGKTTTEVIDGVRVHRVRAYRRGVHEASVLGALSFVALAAIRLRSLARENDYDAYHYYFGQPTGLLSLVPGMHRNRPYVVSLRGSDVPGYDPELDWLHRPMLPLTRRIWRGAYRVVANSQALRLLALNSAPGLPIEVISNGATETAALPEPRRADTGLRILSVSRLIARKGLDTLIAALAQAGRPDLSLDIVGDGPIRASLSQLAASLGVADRVRLHGFLDQSGLARLYAQADIFVLPSVAESCSMALLEAMAAGLPLIATKVGGTIELVEHGYNGLTVGAKNVDDLSAALKTLARDPQQRERFSAANRHLVRERFSWHSIARQYESVFQESLNPPAAADSGIGLANEAD
jgi:glycosyltransferase involved in cell wall biosynthesis